MSPFRYFLAAYLSRCGVDGALQNSRARAAALARRNFSCVIACSSNAARSAASTEPWVGRTHAVGQRVIPLVRINSAITASPPLALLLCPPFGRPTLPPPPRASVNREITSPHYDSERKAAQRAAQAPNSSSSPTADPGDANGWRPRGQRRPLLQSAIRRNAEFLTQCPGPSAPPYPADRDADFTVVEDWR